METVKVDIQKLQLLNDRIAQTIEALNQVRMSVHGIQHAPTSPWGYGAYPGAQLGFAQGMNPQFNPYAQFMPQQFAPQQFAPQQFATQFGPQFGGPSPYGQFGVGGLSHSTVTPWQTTPWQPAQTPWQTTTQTPWQVTGQTPWTNGISHSSWDPIWQANWQVRQQQMFPFVGYPATLS
jgi:hypothetical protein